MSSPLNRPHERPEELDNGKAREPVTPVLQSGAARPDLLRFNRCRNGRDLGLVSFASIAGHYRIAADPFQLAHDFGRAPVPLPGGDIVRAAPRLELRARPAK